MPGCVSLQGFNGFRVEQSVYILEEIGIGYIQIRKRWSADRVEVQVQVESRRQCHRLIPRHLVIALFRIAPLGTVHRSLGQRGFNSQYSLRRIRRLLRRSPGENEKLRSVIHQMLAHLYHLGIVLDVVIAVRQGKPTLVNIRDDHIGIVQIGRRIESK